jgi:serine protease
MSRGSVNGSECPACPNEHDRVGGSILWAMSDKPTTKRRGVLWLLLLLLVVLVWWWWRPPADNGNLALAVDDMGDLDDILVDFKDDVSASRIAEIGKLAGVELQLVSDQSADERFYRAHVEPSLRDETIARLAAQPEVEIAEPDATVYLIDQRADPAPDDDVAWKDFPNDPKYKFQWHMGQINMPKAWKLADGDGVIVAVIDTGVAYENRGKKFHMVPDLEGVPMTKPYDFVNNTKYANDDHGHGTHVAGTIAQATNNGVGVAGIARKATIMPLKVLSASGSGSVGGIADAIRYAADEGAKVINMSLGGRFRSKVLEKAVKYAHDKGVTVVCAAGNDGSGRVSYPAAYPGSVAVAATQFDESTTFYSNWGKEIDVAAPGGNTKVDQNKDGMPDGVLQNTITVGDPTSDGYFPFMGTSMASPHVAGVAALIVGQGVTEPDAVEKILKETARAPQGKDKFDTARYGAGIIDADAAVRKARSGAGGWQLGLGLVLAGALAASARRRGQVAALSSTPTYLVGVLFGASGLFFLPYLGGIGATLSQLPILASLTHGFPSWDLGVLGAGSHGNPLFFSALVPLFLVTVGYGARKLRAPLAGFAAGVGGHLAFHVVARVADIRFIPNSLDAVWLGLNAVACGVIAYLTLRE